MPESSRFYVGFIQGAGSDPVWLTSDGTETGTAAKLELSGEDQFDGGAYGLAITPAASGAIHRQAVALDFAGIAFEIKILFCPSALLSLLRAALEPTRHSAATARVFLSSVKREIDVLAVANGNDWLSTGSFSGTMIRDVTLRLLSTGKPSA